MRRLLSAEDQEDDFRNLEDAEEVLGPSFGGACYGVMVCRSSGRLTL